MPYGQNLKDYKTEKAELKRQELCINKRKMDIFN